MYFHISAVDIGDTGPYVPFIPRNDDVRVCMRRTGAAASGNSDRDTLRGSFIHRFNGVGECENPRTRHVDTEMAPLRAIIPEIDALRHASRSALRNSSFIRFLLLLFFKGKFTRPKKITNRKAMTVPLFFPEFLPRSGCSKQLSPLKVNRIRTSKVRCERHETYFSMYAQR